MLVVVHHYFYWCAPASIASRPPWLDAVFGTDRFGMTCFFTLSGFVIAYNYFDFGWKQHPLKSTAHFLFLRFSRLYPALLVFIGMVVLMRWTSQTYANGFGDWVALHLASVQSWLPFKLNGALPDANLFHVSWSISTEFMLYFMFDLFMVLLVTTSIRWGKAGAAILLGLLAAYMMLVINLAASDSRFEEIVASMPSPLEPLNQADWKRWFFYLSPYVRVLEFVLGIAAALLVMRHSVVLAQFRWISRLVASFAVLGLLAWYALPLVFASNMQPARVFQLIVPPLLFAAVLANSRDQESLLNRFLSSAPLIFIGEVSYSLYLFHPLSPRIGIVWQERTFDLSLLPYLALNMAATAGCAIVFAYGMYRLVEMPAQRGLRHLWNKLSVRPVRTRRPAALVESELTGRPPEEVLPGAERIIATPVARTTLPVAPS